MKARSLFLLPQLRGGGAQRVTLELLKGMAGVELADLYLLENRGHLMSGLPPKVQVISPKQGRWRTLSYLRSILQYIWLARNYEVLVGALELKSIVLSALSGLLWRKPTIGWLHKDLKYYLSRKCSPPKRLVYYAVAWGAFRLLHHLVAVSEGVKQSATDLYPFLRDKTSRIYNPIDTDRIINESLKTPEVEIPPNRLPLIVAIGRLEWQKGLDMLLRAMALLKEGGFPCNLVLLGDGSEETRLQQLAQVLGLHDLLIMPGFINPFPVLKRSGVFVLSSRYEGLPTVIMEAMTLGVPVVAFDCPSGPRELLDDGQAGYLARPEDAEDLANGIRKMITDNEYREHCLAGARAKATRLGIKSIVDEWSELLKQLRVKNSRRT